MGTGPPQAVVVAQGDGVTNIGRWRQLQLAEFLGGQLAPLPSALVHARFERMHGYLAEDSGKDRSSFCRQGLARLRARDQIDLALNTSISANTEAVSASTSGVSLL